MERLCIPVYAKHGNFVNANASGAKASTKHVESRLEVIQGHAFWDHWKADEGLRLIMWALESEISKERSEHSVFENPTVIRRPLSIGNPCDYSHWH